MKRLLLVGDIHANYPALRAVWHYVRSQHFDYIVNTGDFTVYATFPNQTIQWFQQRKNTVCILGNTDRRILKILNTGKLKRPRKAQKRVMYFWTAENLRTESIAYLRTLPEKTEFMVGRQRIGVFHGTADDPEEALYPTAPESRFRQLAKTSPCRVHIMGHSHVPYHKVAAGVHFVNPGSTGRMFDGDPRPSFAVMTLSAGMVNVVHFRIPYAVERVVKDLEKQRLPEIYTTMFRVGRKLN